MIEILHLVIAVGLAMFLVGALGTLWCGIMLLYYTLKLRGIL